jgi:hypothetical protein
MHVVRWSLPEMAKKKGRGKAPSKSQIRGLVIMKRGAACPAIAPQGVLAALLNPYEKNSIKSRIKFATSWEMIP